MKSPLLQKLKSDFEKNKKSFRLFISRTENKLNEGHSALMDEVEKNVWKNTDCLSCANCCKSMSPTYTNADILRISKFLGMSTYAFKKKWLYFDKKSRDWMNVSRPCQFLDLKTNMCSVYEVRPADCAGFPHLTKKPFGDYFYIHKQNIEYCPATYSMIERLKNIVHEKGLETK